MFLPLGSTPGLRDRITGPDPAITYSPFEGPQQALHLHCRRRSARGQKRQVAEQLVELASGSHAAKARTGRSSASGWGAHSRSAQQAAKNQPKRPFEDRPGHRLPVTARHHRPTAARQASVIVWLSPHRPATPASLPRVDGIDPVRPEAFGIRPAQALRISPLSSTLEQRRCSPGVCNSPPLSGGWFADRVAGAGQQPALDFHSAGGTPHPPPESRAPRSSSAASPSGRVTSLSEVCTGGLFPRIALTILATPLELSCSAGKSPPVSPSSFKSPVKGPAVSQPVG